MVITKAKTIMVVDDEPDLLRITTKMLENDGYDVHAFRNPEKALDHVEVENCNECAIIVSDIRMPVINGIELAKRIKKLRPEIKVILMSAFEIHKEEWHKVLPSSDIDEFVQKPVKMSDLVDTIKKYARA